MEQAGTVSAGGLAGVGVEDGAMIAALGEGAATSLAPDPVEIVFVQNVDIRSRMRPGSVASIACAPNAGRKWRANEGVQTLPDLCSFSDRIVQCQERRLK